MNHFTVRQMRQVTEASYVPSRSESLHLHFLTRLCRFKWAHQRKVFGKALIDQPVIRAKYVLRPPSLITSTHSPRRFADMFARCESAQAWLEQITYQVRPLSSSLDSITDEHPRWTV